MTAITVSLREALKLKKKYAGIVSKLETKLTQNNSYVVEQKTPLVDTKEILRDLLVQKENLSKIKTAIATANLPVNFYIYKMAELKSLIATLQRLDTKEGEFITTVDYSNTSTKETRRVHMSSSCVEELINEYEDKIQEFQEILDKHNINTLVTIELN